MTTQRPTNASRHHVSEPSVHFVKHKRFSLEYSTWIISYFLGDIRSSNFLAQCLTLSSNNNKKRRKLSSTKWPWCGEEFSWMKSGSSQTLFLCSETSESEPMEPEMSGEFHTWEWHCSRAAACSFMRSLAVIKEDDSTLTSTCRGPLKWKSGIRCNHDSRCDSHTFQQSYSGHQH